MTRPMYTIPGARRRDRARSPLTPDEIRQIRAAKSEGMRSVVIAARHGITPQAVNMIARGALHASV